MENKRISPIDMLTALKMVRDVDYLHTYGGICANAQSALLFVDVRISEVTDFLIPYFKRWPKFSGNPDYPVSHPRLMPDEAYFDTKHYFEKYTEYGRNRWELLHFLIDELEQEINNSQ